MSFVAIAIKTIPDIDAGKRLHTIQNLSDEGVAKAMFHLHQQQTGMQGLPLYLQRIVAISVAYEGHLDLNSTVLMDDSLSEKSLLEQYVAAVQGKQQVAWNGNMHEFPILQYRALKAAVTLPELSEQVDLRERLSFSQEQFHPDLSEMSHFLELPTLTCDSVEATWETYLSGNMESIAQSAKVYSENVYQVFRRL